MDDDAKGATNGNGKHSANDSSARAGWGSWAGLGVREQRPSKRALEAKAKAEADAAAAKRARLDAQLPTVIITEKRQKRSAKLKIAQVLVCCVCDCKCVLVKACSVQCAVCTAARCCSATVYMFGTFSVGVMRLLSSGSMCYY
jgi:Utp14 protein